MDALSWGDEAKKKTHHSEVKLRVFVPWKNVHTTN
jgi:hypothetical protein